MNTYLNRKPVTFEDVPALMNELLDQMKLLNDRMEFMEGNMVSHSRADDKRELLSTAEVCKMLKVARITVYRMANRGDIPCYRSGKTLKFYKGDIEEWIDSGKTNEHMLELKTKANEFLNSHY